MLSEEQLIEGCKQSDPGCFQALYQRYAGRLMSIALRYCNTTFEAEDVLQEAFLVIFAEIRTYQGKGSFEGWLKRIVVRMAINHYHKHKKHYPTDLAGETVKDTDSEADNVN